MKPKKIPVVEDNKMMIKMYEVMPRQCPLVYASDGRNVLDRLAEHHDIDLMLLSLNLPTLTAWTCWRDSCDAMACGS